MAEKLHKDAVYKAAKPEEKDYFIFIRIQLRCVRWQKDQLQLALLLLHKGFNDLSLMNRMAMNDQHDRLFGAAQQTLQEFDKHLGGDVAFLHHKAKIAPRAKESLNKS